MADLPPELLELQKVLAGRYLLTREIGRGGMGVVVQAQDLALDRFVAIKLLPPHLAARADLRERFLREARTAGRLTHPNIVPIHAVEEHGDLLLFVMSYIEGESLDERVARAGPLPVAESIRVVQEVAWALSLAHRSRVIHRDIKPGNILLEAASGRAMVTDFGIARREDLEGLTATNEVVGTLKFMSPEQASGQEVDARSDLFSLGMTAFYALSGRTPYEAENWLKAALPTLVGTPELLSALRPEVPRNLLRIVARCLAADPSDRYATAEELADDLGATRAAVPEVSREVNEFVDGLNGYLKDLGGYGNLMAYSLLNIYVLVPLWYEPRGAPTLAILFSTLGLLFLAGALAVLATGGMIKRGRSMLARGFGYRDVQAALLPAAALDHRSASTTLLRRAGWLTTGAVGIAGLVTLWVLIEAHTWRWSVVLWTVPMSIVLLGTIVAAGRFWAGRAIHGWQSLWAGRLGRSFLRLAGIGLSDEKKRAVSYDPTEMAVAEAAEEVFDALPPKNKARLADVPKVIRRLEADAKTLRRREAEIVRALADAGLAGSASSALVARLALRDIETGDDSPLVRRFKAVAQLQDAREQVNHRHGVVVTALESLRLNLLRLRAGVGSIADISEDVARAQEIEQEIDAEMDAHTEVQRLLES